MYKSSLRGDSTEVISESAPIASSSS